MTISFAGKVVFIAGAASGLGRATAIAFAKHAATLSLLDANEQGLAETRVSAESAGAACLTHLIDISDKASYAAAIAATVARYRRLNVLCNIGGPVHLPEGAEISEQDRERILAVNLNVPSSLSQAAIPHLLENAGNIVSVAAPNGANGTAQHPAPYAEARDGLIEMTRSLAAENASLRINAIMPGVPDPAINQGADPHAGIDPALLQHLSEPDEIARLILYVASDQAGALSGACLSADTGIAAG